ncbi:MAG: YcxB family protein [Clostridiales bacterium]|nr:YcxB family protein [Clostridiales bacterium]
MSEEKTESMPESIVENSCTYTENVMGELFGRLMRKRLIGVGLFWFVIVGMFVLLAFKGSSNWMANLSMAIVSVVLIIQLVNLPKKQAKTVTRKYKNLYNCDQEDMSIFYEDHIYATNLSSKAELELTYDKIKCMIKTKNLYAITLKSKSLMLLDRHNFTKGTEEDFLNLMQSKNILIK